MAIILSDPLFIVELLAPNPVPRYRRGTELLPIVRITRRADGRTLSGPVDTTRAILSDTLARLGPVGFVRYYRALHITRGYCWQAGAHPATLATIAKLKSAQRRRFRVVAGGKDK